MSRRYFNRMDRENLPPNSRPTESSEDADALSGAEAAREGAHEIHRLLDDPLARRNEKVHAEALAALEARKREAAARRLPAYESYVLPALETQLCETLDAAGLDGAALRLAPPPENLRQKLPDVDLAWNAAALAKTLGRPAPDVAQQVAALLINHPLVDRAEATGPFVNLALDWRALYRELCQQIDALGAEYGHSDEGRGQVVVLDFSSPNVAKNMTLAHLRSTVIGRAIGRLYEAGGYTTFRVNHLGDWGTQFGQLICQWQEEEERDPEGFQERLDADPVGTLMRAYRRFHERLDEEPQLEREGRELFLRLERGDAELLEKWQTAVDASRGEFQRMYARLGVEFDAYQGESFYRDRMDGPVEEGLATGALERTEDGAIQMPGQRLTDPETGQESEAAMRDRDSDELQGELLVKPSGGTVYLTRDLAAIRYRGQQLGADRIRYVIGKEQARHCQILFNLADQLGYAPLGAARHVSFGHLNLDGKKAKSRKGKVILLKDVLNEAVASAEARIRQSKVQRGDEPTLSDRERQTAETIGVGSVVYNDLRQDRRKDIQFDPETAGQVTVGGAPYAQYTYARLSGVLRKSGEERAEPTEDVPLPEELSELERGLLLRIALWPQVLSEARALEAPHKVATYLEDLAQQANRFYESHPVAKAPANERAFRRQLVAQLKQVFSSAADILGVGLPERI